jgi:FlaG/FlaF family flagellin (archaellin)
MLSLKYGRGISPVLASVLLIGMVAVSATILAAWLNRSMPGGQTPWVSLDVQLRGGNLILKHRGGSPLFTKDLEIFLDGSRVSVPQSTILELGENISIPVSVQAGKIYRVSLVYIPAGKLLYSANILSS